MDKVLTNLDVLQNDLHVNAAFLGHFIAKSLFTTDDSDIISSKVSKSERVLEFVKILNTKGSMGFDVFCEALTKTKQQHVLEEMKTNGTYMCKGKNVKTREPVEDYYCRLILQDKGKQVLCDNNHLILQGPPGAGKTELATKLSQDMRGDETWGNETQINGTLPSDKTLCITIDAKGPNDTYTSLLELKKLSQEKFGTDVVFPNYSNNRDNCRALIETIFELFAKHTDYRLILIIDDLVKETKTLLPIRKIPHNILVLITTNNKTLFEKCVLNVSGFEMEEAVAYFQEESDTQEKEDSIKRLAKFMDSSPLGLSIAKKALKISEDTIEEYLKRMKSHPARLKLQRCDSKHLKEYNKGLMVAMENMITEKLKGKLEDISFTALSVAMFLDTNSIENEVLKMILCTIETEEDVRGKRSKMSTCEEINQQISEIKEALEETSLADKSKETVSFHSAAKYAWLSYLWREKTFNEHLQLCFKTITGNCDVDTRFSFSFTAYYCQLRHMESALSHVDTQQMSISLAIYFILTTCIIGNIYTYLYRPTKAEEILQEGRDTFYSYILCRTNKQIEDKTLHNTRQRAERVAEKIYSLIQAQDNNEEIKECANSFFFHKCHNEYRISNWKKHFQLLEQRQPFLLQSKRLTNSLYSHFLENELVLPKEKFSTIFLHEIIIMVLYIYGRIYHYTDKQTIDEVKHTQYRYNLQLAFEISKQVTKKKGVDLYLAVLCERNGLLYMDMELMNKDSLEYSRAMQNTYNEFDSMQNSAAKYYWFGVQEMTCDDLYNNAVCTREKAKCLRYQFGKSQSSEEKENMEKTWQTAHAELASNVEKMSRMGWLQKLHRPQSFTNEIAFFDLEHGSNEKGFEIFSINVNDGMETGRVPYTLTDSVEGSIWCFCKLKDHQRAFDLVETFQKYINKIYGQEGNRVDDKDGTTMRNKHTKTIDELRKYIETSQSSFKRKQGAATETKPSNHDTLLASKRQRVDEFLEA